VAEQARDFLLCWRAGRDYRQSLAASQTGNALAALAALTTAIGNLGWCRRGGRGREQTRVATNLAQSQITNYSAAEAVCGNAM